MYLLLDGRGLAFLSDCDDFKLAMMSDL